MTIIDLIQMRVDMLTLTIENDITLAEQISDILYKVDPDGRHISESDQNNAVEAAERMNPDIIWLDIDMPGSNGMDIAAEFKKKLPKTNIVIMAESPEYAVDAFGLHVSGYILKPVTEEKIRNEINNLRNPVDKTANKKLRIQCFGNFEVFYKGRIMRFSRSLSKEALAYLIDRRGGGCTVGEICSILWEDRQTSTSLKSQCRVILASLMKDLADIGAEDVIIKMWNLWSIDTSKVSCDYYDFLDDSLYKKTGSGNVFNGEYMAQYSWAEMTLGSLYDLTGFETKIEK